MYRPTIEIMKKLVLFTVILTFAIFTPKIIEEMLTENKEYLDVEVVIVDVYYRPGSVIPTGNSAVSIAADYDVTVRYDGKDYVIDSREAYYKYKDKVGQTATGVLEIREYIDGNEAKDIIKLK